MGALNSLATLGLNLALTREAQRREDEQLKNERDTRVREVLLRDREEQRLAEQSLRRRLAEERARAGAAGVGGSGGSADAVLRGLAEESRGLSNARRAEVESELDALRTSFADRRRNNLLDFAGQWLSLGTRALGGSRRSLLD